MQDRVDQGFKSPVFSSPYLNFDPSILNPVCFRIFLMLYFCWNFLFDDFNAIFEGWVITIYNSRRTRFINLLDGSTLGENKFKNDFFRGTQRQNGNGVFYYRRFTFDRSVSGRYERTFYRLKRNSKSKRIHSIFTVCIISLPGSFFTISNWEFSKVITQLASI